MSNLPAWPGADAVYGIAYRVLDWMGRNGFVEIVPKRRGRPAHCVVRDEMTALIKALDMGDEEQIKGLLAIQRIYRPKAFLK